MRTNHRPDTEIIAQAIRELRLAESILAADRDIKSLRRAGMTEQFDFVRTSLFGLSLPEAAMTSRLELVLFAIVAIISLVSIIGTLLQ